MDRATAQRLERLQARHRALAARLSEIGFLTRGSVVKATTTCGKPSCRCHTDAAARHGPYWQWTRAVEGKTITRRLTEAEALRYREWVGNRRQAVRILEQMEELCLMAAELLRGDEVDRAPRRGGARDNRPG